MNKGTNLKDSPHFKTFYEARVINTLWFGHEDK